MSFVEFVGGMIGIIVGCVFIMTRLRSKKN